MIKFAQIQHTEYKIQTEILQFYNTIMVKIHNSQTESTNLLVQIYQNHKQMTEKFHVKLKKQNKAPFNINTKGTKIEEKNIIVKKIEKK